jgi:actin-related protein
VDLAGRDLTLHMNKLLRDKAFLGNSPAAIEIIRDIKEKHCLIAEDYTQALSEVKETQSYSLPDGRKIEIDKEGL